MILQELCRYYQRKAADPEGGIAPEGFEWKPIPFLIVIDREGRFVGIQDTREGEGKKKVAKDFLVPKDVGRAGSKIAANCLWDSAEYALGANPRQRKDIEGRHKDFRSRLDELARNGAHPELEAVRHFLGRDAQAEISASAGETQLYKEVFETNPNITFRVEGSDYSSVCDALFSHIMASRVSSERKGRCLVSGESAPIPNTHHKIKGVWGAQTAGATLVSFNEKAYESYGKEQNHNAPVGESSAFAYTTALNHLLAKDSRQKIQLGDATTVFWSEKKNALEGDFAALFGFTPKDDPDAESRAVASLYSSTWTGVLENIGDTRFFVLGLAPNAARLSVRFWHPDTLSGLSAKLRQHFDDLEIVMSPKDHGHRALMPLLCSLVLEGKADNIPPNLAGAVVRAVLEGTAYPSTLLHLAVRRIRADVRPKQNDTPRLRAAVLKAVLNRALRQRPNNEKEITVALDPSNLSPGYRLGRLFAVLEKIQEDAQPGINATIRDRYYGAASSSPSSVFPQLLKLKNHHLAKLDNAAFKAVHERRLAEIFDGIVDMPAHLSMEDQARFAIGYYHQRQAFFIKTAKPETQA